MLCVVASANRKFLRTARARWLHIPLSKPRHDAILSPPSLRPAAPATTRCSRAVAQAAAAVKRETDNDVFDFPLALTLAGASFEAYADVESKGSLLMQHLPNTGATVQYTDASFLQTTMAGLLKVSIKEDTKTYHNSNDDIEDKDKTQIFEVSVGHDSCATLSLGKDGSSEEVYLFVRDPKRQWLSVKLVNEGDKESPATSLMELTEIDTRGNDTTNKTTKTTEHLVLKQRGGSEKHAGNVEVSLEMLPFTHLIAEEASKPEISSDFGNLLSCPGPALMSKEWQKLVKTVVTQSKAALDPVAFIENADTDTQVWIFWSLREKMLVVAFRGTEQGRWRDLLTDANLTPLPLNAAQMAELPRSLSLADITEGEGTVQKVLGHVARAQKEIDAAKKLSIASTVEEEEEEDQQDGAGGVGGVTGAVGAALSKAEELSEILSRVKTLVDENQASGPKHGIWVHTGFLNAYDSVRAPVLGLIESVVASKNDKDEDPWTIVLTGHSLGGALATLCALDVAQRQISSSAAQEEEENQSTPRVKVQMYNFGSPRVGNLEFAQQFDKCVNDAWRVVNANDAVATIPRLIGYHHVGHCVAVMPDGEVKVQHSSETPFEGASVEQIYPAVAAALTSVVTSAVPEQIGWVSTAATTVATTVAATAASITSSKSDVKTEDNSNEDETGSVASSINSSDLDEVVDTISTGSGRVPLSPAQLEDLWNQEKEAWKTLLRGNAINEHMEEEYFAALQRAAEKAATATTKVEK